MSFAELKGIYDHELMVLVNPNNANRLSYFGTVIAQWLTDGAQLVIQQLKDKIGFALQLQNNWESEFNIPIAELEDFFLTDEPVSEYEEGTRETDPETEMTAETDAEGSEEKAPEEIKSETIRTKEGIDITYHPDLGQQVISTDDSEAEKDK